MNPRPLVYLIAGVVLGYLGFSIALCIGLGGFEAEFTAGNLIQSATTLVAAVIVTSVLQKRSQIEFRKKELLVKQIDLGVSKLLELTAMDFVAGSELVKVTASLKQISLIFKSVSSGCKSLGLVGPSFDFSSKISELRKIATDTPIPALVELADCGGACSSEVKDNILKLNSDRIGQIQSHIQTIQTKAFEIQLLVLDK